MPILACSSVVLTRTATAAESLPASLSPQAATISVPVLTASGATGYCEIQQLGDASDSVDLNSGNIDLNGTTTSTSGCSSTYVPQLNSYVLVENLNPVQYSSASNTSAGSGYGPVVASATDSVSPTVLGPSFRFTWVTYGQTNLGSFRLCQQSTTADFVVVTSYTQAC